MSCVVLYYVTLEPPLKQYYLRKYYCAVLQRQQYTASYVPDIECIASWLLYDIVSDLTQGAVLLSTWLRGHHVARASLAVTRITDHNSTNSSP